MRNPSGPKIYFFVAGFFSSLLWSQTFVMPNIRVDPTESIQRNSSLAYDLNGNPYVAWRDTRELVDKIYFAKSNDGGISFLPSVEVCDSNYGTKPSLAIDNLGNPHIVWLDYKLANYRVFYARSNNGGTTFLQRIPIDQTPGSNQNDPFIALDENNNPYVVWSAFESGYRYVYYTNSTDGGNSFKSRVKIDTFSTHHNWPRLALDALNNSYVTWEDGRRVGKTTVFFAKSTDGGLTFTLAVMVDTVQINQQRYSWLGLDSDANPHIVWEDPSTSSLVKYAKSTDGGASFVSSISIDPGITPQLFVSISIDQADNPVIAWQGGDLYVYASKSTDGGNSFLPKVRVDNTVSGLVQQWSKVGVDFNNEVCVSYEDNRGGAGYRIFYAKGSNWQIDIDEKNKGQSASGGLKAESPRLVIYPNPFCEKTTIRYMMQDARYKINNIKIYNSTGQLVKSFNHESCILNHESVISWEGNDNSGRQLPAGVYYCELQINDFRGTEKIILLR